jgi:hypothetical protein
VMGDWVEDMNPEERAAWDDFVAHFRKDAAGKIAGSQFFVSIFKGEWDVKFCTELGTAIMMDKPIVLLVHPGEEIPVKLLTVADGIIEADMDTLEGRKYFADRLAEWVEGSDG